MPIISIYADALCKALEIFNDRKASPTVKVVPIVQCKDCKHLMFSDCYGECGAGHLGIVRPDDFCSRGERKDTTGGNNETV